MPFAEHTDAMVALVERSLLELERARPGERIVLVAGMPPGTPGRTNTIRVHRLGAAP
jgi:pyruvate kinase